MSVTTIIEGKVSIYIETLESGLVFLKVFLPGKTPMTRVYSYEERAIKEGRKFYRTWLRDQLKECDDVLLDLEQSNTGAVD